MVCLRQVGAFFISVVFVCSPFCCSAFVFLYFYVAPLVCDMSAMYPCTKHQPRVLPSSFNATVAPTTSPTACIEDFGSLEIAEQ